MAIGAPTLSASNSEDTTAATIAITVPGGGIAAGADIVVHAAAETPGAGPAQTLSTVTDSRGNTWTVDVTQQRGLFINVAIAHCRVGTTLQAADTITLTWTGSTIKRRVAAYTVTGLSGAAAEQTGGANNSGTAVSVATAGATTTADSLVFMSEIEYSATETFTAGSGYTELSVPFTGIGTSTEYKIVAATGVQTADGTITSNPWAAVVATYPGAAAAAAWDKRVQALYAQDPNMMTPIGVRMYAGAGSPPLDWAALPATEVRDHPHILTAF